MSGGFFRGTSADQDTRFSNKHAKLMKSQKFAPELESLVDITKVKMDVMRPWIANRVTELLGFEDEVLINFIYGLLDGKVVNGKEIQISLTGFMEKNTGKFMKELWTLLLSAEKNVSGVPQQFLDEKEEETRKKKAETDRIAFEIQKRKEEARELEQEKAVKMDAKVDNKLGRHHPKESSARLSAYLEETNERNGSRGRIRGTPSRSDSGSFSNSRSRSDERHRSRSISRSPMNRGSVSSERVHHSPLRRSTSPRHRGSPRQRFSPSRRRTSQYSQSSISPSRRRARSPVRRRSPTPVRRRSPTPVRRRSRSPVRRRSRSPVRRRSRSPVRRRSRTPPRRRRSPMRYRSRSLVRYRSRSPVRRSSRSPVRRRSPSPVRRRSPSPVLHQSPSPVRQGSSPVRRRSPPPSGRVHQRSLSSPHSRSLSPVQRRLAIPSHKRSPIPGSQSSSPRKLSSQSPVYQAPNSRDGRSAKHQSSPAERPQSRIRTQGQQSSGRHSFLRDITARSSETNKGSTLERRTHLSPPRSSQRDPNDRNRRSRRMPSSTPSPYNSPSGSESPPPSRIKSADHRRANSPYESPVKEPVIQDVKPSPPRKSKLHTATPVSPRVEKAQISSEVKDAKNKPSGKKPMHLSTSDEIKVSAKTRNDIKGSEYHDSDTLSRMSKKAQERNSRDSVDSDDGASDKHRAEVGEKRKHKRSKRQVSDDDYSSDSQLDGRKEAKRRRKEEKKLQKEERRRRREERRRKKEGRRAGKIKLKSTGTVSPPPDLEKNRDDYNSDDPRVARRDSHSSDNEEESEPKKLEIALRKKALESLRAKKGVGH